MTAKNTTTENYDIKELGERPEHYDAVAGMVFEHWPEEVLACDGCATKAEYCGLLRSRGGAGTLVAVCRETGDLAGTVSVVENDLPDRPWLGPWLASLVVSPEHRRRGLGAELVRRAVDLARQTEPDLRMLYLWTRRELLPFYKNLGWSAIEVTTHMGNSHSNNDAAHDPYICIMKYNLRNSWFN